MCVWARTQEVSVCVCTHTFAASTVSPGVKNLPELLSPTDQFKPVLREVLCVSHGILGRVMWIPDVTGDEKDLESAFFIRQKMSVCVCVCVCVCGRLM